MAATYSITHGFSVRSAHHRLLIPPLLIIIVFCFGFVLLQPHASSDQGDITASSQSNPSTDKQSPQTIIVPPPYTKLEQIAPPAGSLGAQPQGAQNPAPAPATMSPQPAPQNTGDTNTIPPNRNAFTQQALPLHHTIKSLLRGIQ